MPRPPETMVVASDTSSAPSAAAFRSTTRIRHVDSSTSGMNVRTVPWPACRSTGKTLGRIVIIAGTAWIDTCANALPE